MPVWFARGAAARGAARAPGAAALAALAALALAALPAALLAGFTVDDAWIAPRYAAHLAAGLGHRFNPGGPATDGVTPLPWAPLLAPFAALGAEPLGVWRAGRALGAIAWLASAAYLGARAAHVGGRAARFLPLAALAASAPLGAWACAGTETALATALVALAAAAPGPAFAAAACGAAASLRPELLPFAGVVGLWRSLRPAAPAAPGADALAAAPAAPAAGDPAAGAPGADALAAASAAHAADALAAAPAAPAAGDPAAVNAPWRAFSFAPFALAVAPWLAVVATRLALFGRPVPLAVDAKPSDFTHGATYALAGLLLGGFPALAFAPFALARRPELARARWLVAAALAHAASLSAAGGDWMPLSRLWVPVFPALLLAAVDVAALAPLGWTLARLLVALAALAFVWTRAGAAAAGVVATRLPLVERARTSLAPDDVVAALDVGWLAAAGDHRIVDLAGRTDPSLAALPGGHTSKRVPSALLDARGVTALVVLSGAAGPCRAERTPGARVVEERLLRDPWIAEAFEPSDAWASGPLCYVVWRKKGRGPSR